ncbi:MAG: CRTAC1 family protein [Planctomycetota bacterium]|jgi:hypothetical protein
MGARRIPNIVTVLTLVLAFLPSARAGEAPKKEDPPKKEGGITEKEIKAKEIEILEAFKKNDYIQVFRHFEYLLKKGVKVMDRPTGEAFLVRSVDLALAYRDSQRRIELSKAFLSTELSALEDLTRKVTFALARDCCDAGIDLDKVEALALQALRLNEKALAEMKEDTPERRIRKADHSRFLELVGFTHYRNGNFDKKENHLLKTGKKVRISKFIDVTKKAGLEGKKGKRVTVADLDEDGKEDILIDGWIVLKNRGDATFEDATGEFGLPEGLGALAVDLDNNGTLDLVQLAKEKERVFLNGGFGSFKEVPDPGLVPGKNVTGGAAAADFDGDGLVDLYRTMDVSRKPVRGYVSPATDVLSFNEGKGRFRDGSKDAGITKVPGMLGWGVTVCDFDGDGDPDIYVANRNYHLDRNYLWENDGKGVFKETGEARSVAGKEKSFQERKYHGHSYASAFGDVDGDGLGDLFVANFCQAKYVDILGGPVLLRNRGRDADFVFEDATRSSGIPFASNLADASMVDVDHDGDLDIHVASRITGYQSFLYLNDGKGNFTDATWHARTPAFNAYGHAWGDFDGDGDLDLVVASPDGVRLLKNGCSKKPGWISLKLQGKKSNGSAVGARVTVRLKRKTLVREVACGRGNTCQDSLRVHFGLGRIKEDVDVEVRWPSGKVLKKTLAPKRRHTLREE